MGMMLPVSMLLIAEESTNAKPYLSVSMIVLFILYGCPEPAEISKTISQYIAKRL